MSRRFLMRGIDVISIRKVGTFWQFVVWYWHPFCGLIEAQRDASAGRRDKGDEIGQVPSAELEKGSDNSLRLDVVGVATQSGLRAIL